MISKHAAAIGWCMAALALAGCATTPQGSSSPVRLAVSANDAKVFLDDGVSRAVANPPPDTVTIIDLASTPPKVIAEVEAATSVAGPPLSVAVAPDESYALVTSATRADPKDPSKIIPNDVLSVIDLTASPPRVVQTLRAGMGAAGVSINRAGTLALVANRNAGTVSVFTISGKSLTAAGTIKLGAATSGPSSVVFTPDGKRALVTRDGDHTLSILAIEGNKVEATDRHFHAGLRPYGADITPDGGTAVVANIGLGQGDADTLSLIDLRANPPRTAATFTVGAGPEGIKLSPDGRWVGVVLHEGSNRGVKNPFYRANGRLLVLRLDGMQLTRVADAPIGRWSQGLVFSTDARTILVQNMMERNIQVFAFDGTSLRETGTIPLKGGGAGIRTAER